MDTEIFNLKMAIQKLEGQMIQQARDIRRVEHIASDCTQAIQRFEIKLARMSAYAAAAGAGMAIVFKIIDHLWK